MAGGQSKGKAGSRRNRATGKGAERRPGEHAREAVAEWGKAARLTGAALSPLARRAAARLSPGGTEKGGRMGDAADAVLAKMGRPGKLASKIGAGSRLVEKARPGKNGAGSNGNGSGGDLPVPIQESIEIAVPIRVAYALATRFEDYPEFSDRADAAEAIDEDTVRFELKLHGGHRRLEIEILDRRAGERLEWRSTEGPQHSGVVSFHELAPRLTHLELSVEIEPEGMVQRLTRTAHLTERAIRSELHRFKAYAELWQDEEELDEPGPDEETEDQASVEEDEGEPVADEGEEDEYDEDEAEYEDDEPVEAYEDEEEEVEDDEEPVEAYEEDEADEEAEQPVEAYPDVEPAPTR